VPSRPRQRAGRRAWRGIAALLAAGLGLAACGDPARDLEVGTVGYVRGFAGAATADEPHAVLVARDVLSAGGTAADAAAAMGLMLSVTLPSSAGIGGGGVCVVHDRDQKKVAVLDFLPPAGGGANAIAVPALPRGLYALQARFGRLRWEQVVMPAERTARFGAPMSRALAREFMANARTVRDGPSIRAVFAPDNVILREGEMMTQLDLAGVLGRLRQRGPATLYGGLLGRELVEAVRDAGGTLSLEALRDYAPRWREPASVAVGDEELFAPPQGVSGHEVVALWPARGTGASLTVGNANAGATGFVVADSFGNAASCALTMNSPFGTGDMLPGFGMFVSKPSPAPGQAALEMAAALLINRNVNEFRLGIAGGGDGAVHNAVRAAAAAVENEGPVKTAIQEMAQRPSGSALVNGVYCPEGLPPFPGSCGVGVDPRGAGYGLLVGISAK